MPAALLRCLGPELKGTGFVSSSEDPRQKKHVPWHVHSATQHTHSHIVLLWVSNNIGLPTLESLAQYPVLSRRTPCQNCYACSTCSLTLSTPCHIYLCRGCRITPAYRVWCLWPNILSLARRPLVKSVAPLARAALHPLHSGINNLVLGVK